ncbi:hypothetical protein ACFL4G_05425 [Thermodesulfobacteriota bacterium]
MSGKRATMDQERGMAMVIGLILIAIVSFAAMMSLNNSNTEILIASNKFKSDTSLCSANAGIEHARHELSRRIITSATSWNSLLEEGGDLLNTTFDRSKYTVTVSNNSNDPSGSDTFDLDNILVVSSNGAFRGANKDIEVELQYVGNVQEYAQELRDSANTSNVSEAINPVTQNIRLAMDIADD